MIQIGPCSRCWNPERKDERSRKTTASAAENETPLHKKSALLFVPSQFFIPHILKASTELLKYKFDVSKKKVADLLDEFIRTLSKFEKT